jgi:hypothetical protein
MSTSIMSLLNLSVATFKLSDHLTHLAISVLLTTHHAQFVNIFVIYEYANFIFCDTVKKLLNNLLHWKLTSQEEVYVINYYTIAKQIRIYYI